MLKPFVIYPDPSASSTTATSVAQDLTLEALQQVADEHASLKSVSALKVSPNLFKHIKEISTKVRPPQPFPGPIFGLRFEVDDTLKGFDYKIVEPK